MTVIVSDSFNRADSTTLGSTDSYNGGSSKAWQYSDASFGISSNQAYLTLGTNSVAFVDSGVSDGYVTVTNVTGQTYTNIILRYTDINNHISVQMDGTKYYIYKRVNGAYTSYGNVSKTIAANDVVKLRMSGATIELFINGVSKLTVTTDVYLTNTKHGISSADGTRRYDNFQIEDLGATGTTGSTLFNLKQSIYSSSSLNYDLKQALYQTLSQSFDSKQSIYQMESSSFDSRQAIYQTLSSQFDSKQTIFNVSATQYDTQQTIYQVASTLFDTLQQIADGGIIGSTRFDTRMVLYSADKAVFDTKLCVYLAGANNYDLKQAIYQASQLQGDMKLVLYANTPVKFDMVQRMYNDGTIAFDTLQQILQDWTQYNEVIRITLNISREQNSTLEITQRMQTELKL